MSMFDWFRKKKRERKQADVGRYLDNGYQGENRTARRYVDSGYLDVYPMVITDLSGCDSPSSSACDSGSSCGDYANSCGDFSSACDSGSSCGAGSFD